VRHGMPHARCNVKHSYDLRHTTSTCTHAAWNMSRSYNMHRATCNMKHTACNMQDAPVAHTACHRTIQHAMLCNMKHATFNAACSNDGIALLRTALQRRCGNGCEPARSVRSDAHRCYDAVSAWSCNVHWRIAAVEPHIGLCYSAVALRWV
jgi:hypothetical protein